MQNLGKVIKGWRKSEGLTQKDVCASVGIAPAVLSRLENGRNVDGATLSVVLQWLLVLVR